MRLLTTVVRVLYGLAFTVFGLNGLLMAFGKGFLPMPEKPPPEAAVAFVTALSNTGFMMQAVAGVQLLSGLMILSGIFVPLGLTLLAPIVVVIVLHHLYLDPAGLVIAWVVLGLGLFLAFAYGPAFRGVLDPAAKPRWGKAPSTGR